MQSGTLDREPCGHFYGLAIIPPRGLTAVPANGILASVVLAGLLLLVGLAVLRGLTPG